MIILNSTRTKGYFQIIYQKENLSGIISYLCTGLAADRHEPARIAAINKIIELSDFVVMASAAS